jgi:hypothetical protein
MDKKIVIVRQGNVASFAYIEGSRKRKKRKETDLRYVECAFMFGRRCTPDCSACYTRKLFDLKNAYCRRNSCGFCIGSIIGK